MDDLPAMDSIAELVDSPLAPMFCLHKPLTLEGRTVLVRQRQGRQCGKLNWPQLGPRVPDVRGAGTCRPIGCLKAARRLRRSLMGRCCKRAGDHCRFGWNRQGA
jgi:hypothetical protein